MKQRRWTRYRLGFVLGSVLAVACGSHGAGSGHGDDPGFVGFFFVAASGEPLSPTWLSVAANWFVDGGTYTPLTNLRPAEGSCRQDDFNLSHDWVVYSKRAAESATSVPAGSPLMFTTPIGTFPIVGDANFSPPYFGVLVSDGAFAPGFEYTIDAPGGAEFPPFHGALVSPGGLRLVNPSPNGPMMAFDRSAGLPVHWESTGSADTVVISVQNENQIGWGCGFPDTGDAVLAPTLLSQIPPGTYSLVVEKNSVGAFTVPGKGVTATFFHFDEQAIVRLQ